MTVTFADVEAARRRIGGALYVSPLAQSEFFSNAWKCQLYFKLENLQMTGSFKERGALNRLLTLTDDERRRGVVTASAGNHAQAIAHHARRLGIPATIVMPINTPIIKVQNTEAAGARTILEGANYDEAAEHARTIEHNEQLTYVHGFDDPYVIAGQGTLGLELLEQCPYLDTVVVPVGGGGLIAGLALAMKEINPRVRIVGVQAACVPSMLAAMQAGAPVTVEGAHTIADGVAVRRVGELPFAIVQKYVDELVTVSEEEIANAILLMLEREKTVVEGAGAVAVAALHNGHVKADGRRVACILSGGNIDVNILSRVISKGLVKDGRLIKLRVLVPDYPGQLSRILGVIAEERANILEIQHSRAFSAAQVGETAIDLDVETRGPEHIQQIQNALLANGYQANRVQY